MTADERHMLVRRKIERADEHINDLKVELGRFLNSNPYKVATKRNPQTGQLIYYLASVAETPLRFATITGDILNNLRSTLDHLAQQLFIVGSGGSAFRDKTSFPISPSAKDFKARLGRKVEGMRQDAIDAICALEPCNGGNGADLWSFHRLNNIDKHRLLVTVGARLHSLDIAPKIIRTMREKSFGGWPDSLPVFELFLRPTDSLFPLKAGDELLIDLPEEEPNEKIPFRFEIVLNEPGVVEGQPLLKAAVQFRDRISNIVDTFKPCLA